MSVNRLISLFLVLVAIAVTGQFVAYPLYGFDSRGESLASARRVWDVLNWFMAAGLVLMLATTYREKIRQAGDASVDLRPWLRSNVMFYATVLVALAFVPNWFASNWGGRANGTVWHLLDTVIPVIFAVEAHRLWRSESV